MAAGTVTLPGQSFFAEELKAIQRADRRDFLKEYVCESLIALLIGVLDQAKCMALVLGTPGIAIGPFMLSRGLLEYSYKIAYLAEPEIEPNERICRALRLYTTDVREFQKSSNSRKSYPPSQHVTSSKGLADCWYRELTGKKLSAVSTKAIMDSVWKAGLHGLEQQDLVLNEVYEFGYRAGSAVAHGNTWAIRLFCLEAQYDLGHEVLKPRLQEPLSYDKLILAARTLQSSFAFVVQLGRTLPVSFMNWVEEKIHGLETLRTGIRAN